MEQPVQPPTPQAHRAVDVAIAEFKALRGEIVSRATAQSALGGVGLTAMGVIFGLVINKDGNQQLLRAIPPLAALVNLGIAETYRIVEIGNYIRYELWPYLERRVDGNVEDAADDRLPSWARTLRSHRGRRLSGPLTGLFLDLPASALFVGASVAALLLVDSPDAGLLLAGWLLTAFAILVPIAVSLIVWVREKELGDGAPGSR